MRRGRERERGKENEGDAQDMCFRAYESTMWTVAMRARVCLGQSSLPACVRGRVREMDRDGWSELKRGLEQDDGGRERERELREDWR